MGCRSVVVLLAAASACGRVGFDVPSDAGSDGTGSGTRTYLFQDGFEDTLEPWIQLGDVSVVTGPPTPIEGTSMLRARAGTSSSSRAEVMLPRTMPAGSTIYVRGYYFVPSSYAVTDLSLLEIIQADTDALTVINTPNVGFWSAIESTGGTTNGYLFPRDKWVCVEVRVSVSDAPSGTFAVWIDGDLAYTQASLDTFVDGVDELHAGITWAGPSQVPSVVYVDDLIADDAGPIGCR